jgi:hypothetical protein
MDSKIKKLVAGAALAGALTVGTAGVAVAADGSSSGGAAAPDAAASSQPAQTARRHPWLRHQLRKAAVGVVTDTLGVSRQDLRAALQGGQTLTEYTTSLGKDPQTVVDALTNAANSKLDQLVADGKIKPERAETAKSKLPARIDTLMNRQRGQHATA